ncbi:uncharacterized protein LOC124809034 isoform X1 [Hydra vulgaris]|uniref:uncharacterized protein LOC124809034 isoform X1 n=1 Tax=Hydra vulgaris TaxID=6087 RepID=UPI0032E9D273
MFALKHFNNIQFPWCYWYLKVRKEKVLWKYIFNDGNRINKESYLCFSSRADLSHMNSTFEQSVEDVLERWKQKYLIKKQYFEAVFVLGPMGSGKTTIIKRDFKKYEQYQHFSYVDTDEIMELIDGFQPDKVDTFYPTARIISIKLTDWLLDENISFVTEGTCVKHKELEEYMIRLKEKGYKIKVRRVPSVPLDLVLQRVKNRKSRYIAEDVIKDIYFNSEIGINKLFHSNKEKNIFEEL